MCSRLIALFLVAGLLLLPALLPAQVVDPLDADLAALKSAGVTTDGPGLLTFFKKRTLSDETRKKVGNLIALLGADEYSVREQATTDLIDLEGLGRAQVAQALKSSDPEVRRRARVILNKIGVVSPDSHLLVPAARALAARKPAGAAEALLAFLPCIEDAEVAEEVARKLAGVALDKDGKPDPAVSRALADPLPLKRFAAADALTRVGGAAHRPAVRKLLADADLGVRRRVAVSLLEARDRDAIPALIALVSSTSNDDATAAEEALGQVAGEKAPHLTNADAPNARERLRKEWEAWWKDEGAKVDLAKVDFGGVGRGFTLLSMMNTAKGANGCVMELDKAGKVRWRIDGLQYPVHVSLSRRDRVLVCEYYGNRVTERDFKGTVLWSKIVGNQILSAERLPNGNTFIVARNQMLEVDRDGREVKTIPRASYDVLAAHRHKDGKITLLTTTGSCLKLDSAGRQTGSFSIGYLGSTIGFRAHFLPSGNIVVPAYSMNKIREYDSTGKMVWEANATRPSGVVRLTNGNTLYVSRLGMDITEIDRRGAAVATRKTEGRPLFIDRR